MRIARRQALVAVVIALPTLAFVREARSETAQFDRDSIARTHAPLDRRARTIWDSVYTPEQAARGESTYARTCSRCHGPALGGADEAPALTGGAFLASWNGQTLNDLHDRVRTTMPTDTPGMYQRRDISDVIAYVLKFNQFPAGKTELPVGDEDLKAIAFVSAKP